ncbi:MAG TPA: hypothetical protein VMU15_20505 [Anaeromyxobacter sp.]|nr:hypothetical protein [Anaeromyxobacter sp.]
MRSLLHSVRFLLLGPIVLVLLLMINAMTSPGHWWVQWAALGIGIAWAVSLLRVIQGVVVLGGVAALVAWLSSRRRPGASGPALPPGP